MSQATRRDDTIPTQRGIITISNPNLPETP